MAFSTLSFSNPPDGHISIFNASSDVALGPSPFHTTESREEHGKAIMGSFSDAGLEMVPITSIYILLAKSVSYLIKNKYIIAIPNYKEETQNSWYTVLPGRRKKLFGE